jgi:hypothetical protein
MNVVSLLYWMFHCAGRQLTVNEPFVYRAQVPQWVKEGYPALFNASLGPDQHHGKRSPSVVKEELKLVTSAKTEMLSFAKSRAYGEGLLSVNLFNLDGTVPRTSVHHTRTAVPANQLTFFPF